MSVLDLLLITTLSSQERHSPYTRNMLCNHYNTVNTTSIVSLMNLENIEDIVRPCSRKVDPAKIIILNAEFVEIFEKNLSCFSASLSAYVLPGTRILPELKSLGGELNILCLRH